MLSIGTVCAGLSAAVIFAPSFWTSTAILGSASFAGVAFAFGTVRSATVSVALYVVTMGGVAFFASHRSDPLGVLGLVAAVAANAVVAWARLRNNRRTQETH
jgi:hypothetical protein